MEVFINGTRFIPAPQTVEGDYLDVEFYDGKSLNCTVTVREFFHAFLSELWRDPEGFSGKRPFGNSGWYYPVIYALIEAGAIKGVVERDEDGYVEDSKFDAKEADAVVQGLITKMCLGV